MHTHNESERASGVFGPHRAPPRWNRTLVDRDWTGLVRVTGTGNPKKKGCECHQEGHLTKQPPPSSMHCCRNPEEDATRRSAGGYCRINLEGYIYLG